MSKINKTELENKIEKKGLKKSYICTKLNLSYQGLQNKLNGSTEFTANEIGILKDVLNLSADDVVNIFLS